MSVHSRDGGDQEHPAGRTKDVDWAHTASAQANRRTKAERLAAAAAWCGATEPAELAGPDADPEIRAVVLAGAGLRRASEETWAVTAAVLTESAPTLAVPGQTPPCGCTPHPLTHVLYEAFAYGPPDDTGVRRPVSGWLCPHVTRTPEPATPPATLAVPTLAVPALAVPLAVPAHDDGHEPSWDDIARTAHLVDRRSPTGANR